MQEAGFGLFRDSWFCRLTQQNPLGAISVLELSHVNMQGLIPSPQVFFVQSLFQTILYGYYWTTISLGTPSQQMTVIVDSGSGDFWVRGLYSPSYYPDLSTTYQYINSTFQVCYNSGAGAGGDYASDLITVGGQTGRFDGRSCRP